MGYLLGLFILVPAVELALLIEVGSRIGTLSTLALIVVTGIVGASLARIQGFQVLMRIQSSVNRGELPASSLVDGVIILVAGALLITPGLLTDAFGFLCLVPAFRRSLKALAWKSLESAARRNRVEVTFYQGSDPRSELFQDRGPVYDVDVEKDTP